MEKSIHNNQVINIFRKNYLKLLFSVAIVFTLIFATPISSISVYAAPLEDCDLDGYDDATGVPVPWPGYDETKGDKPSGAGSAVTSTKAATTTTTTTTTSNTTNTTSGSTSNAASGSTSNATSGSATNTTSETNTNSGTTTEGTSNTATSVSSNSSSLVSGSTGNTNVASSGNLEANPQNIPVNVNSGLVTSGSLVSESEAVAQVSLDTIINTKGLLKVEDVKGSIIHAGSSIVISGAGFVGNIDGLVVEIHSDPLQLGTVTSSKDGSFQVQFNIPENLKEGTHNIVLSYQGNEITSQQIEVAPKVADSFWEALTVGFSAENKGLIPGLLILAGLILTGGVALAISGINNSRRSNLVSEKVA